MPEERVNIRFIKAYGLFNGGEVASFSEAEAKELCNPFNPQSDRIASWEDKDREEKVQEYIKIRQAGEIQREAAQSIRKKHYMDEYAYDPGRLAEMASEDEAAEPQGSSIKDYQTMQEEGTKLLDELLHPVKADELHSEIIHMVIEDLNKEGVNPNFPAIADKLKEGEIKITQKQIGVSLSFMLETGQITLDPEEAKNKKNYIAKVIEDDD